MSAVDMLYHATAIRDQSNDPRGSFSGVGKQLSRFVPQAEINKALAANRAKWAFLFGPKSFELSGEPATFEGKVRSVILFQNMNMEFNSTPGCGWYGYPRFFSVWTPDHLCEPQSNKVFSAVTGIDCTFGEYLNMMEPAWTLERAIHVREGRRREHDWYSEATFAATKWTTKDEFNKVLDEYYTARGWDKTTGIPTRTQLEKLGMKDVADDLEKKYGVKVPA
jgi:aldehyde:ferredoxin oxidoreductase